MYPENPPFIDGHSIARPIHPECLPIAAALKDCTGLLFKEFVLVVLDEDREEKLYTSAALTPHQQRIFTDRFKNPAKVAWRVIFTINIIADSLI